jgi:hypothetical protein
MRRISAAKARHHSVNALLCQMEFCGRTCEHISDIQVTVQYVGDQKYNKLTDTKNHRSESEYEWCSLLAAQGHVSVHPLYWRPCAL